MITDQKKSHLMIFDLCDNDFGHIVKRAVELLIEEGFYETAGEDCTWWKQAVVKLVDGLHTIRTFQADDHVLKYLDNRLHVYVSSKFPTHESGSPVDHDGGSVVLDLYNKFVTTF